MGKEVEAVVRRQRDVSLCGQLELSWGRDASRIARRDEKSCCSLPFLRTSAKDLGSTSTPLHPNPRATHRTAPSLSTASMALLTRLSTPSTPSTPSALVPVTEREIVLKSSPGLIPLLVSQSHASLCSQRTLQSRLARATSPERKRLRRTGTLMAATRPRKPSKPALSANPTRPPPHRQLLPQRPPQPRPVL